MATTDPRVDAYIEQAAPFAQPILRHLREVVHTACPEVEETMKWSFPHFMHHGILCSMAAFKEHCAFGFWKGALVVGEDAADEKAMGQFGRIASVKDLPARRTLAGYVKKAMALNEAGAPSPARKAAKTARPVETPDWFAAALKRRKGAWAVYDAFSPSCKREYVEWLTDAKTEATRQTRLESALEWIAEGKQRHWKYQKK